MHKDINEILVSVIVVTYNSSKYIVETLDSIYNQTYNNIELIISDDCSTDNTVDLCENWLQINKHRFNNSIMLRATVNTGTSANCNRAFNVCQGEWVKPIAGDDLLMNNCISDCVSFVKANPSCNILFGRMKIMKGSLITDAPKFKINQSNAKAQCLDLLTGTRLPAPTSFIRRKIIMDVNGFDERYGIVEDLPMWIKLSERGNFIYILNSFIVYYRTHESNVSSRLKSSNEPFINILYYKSLKSVILNEINPRLRAINRFGNILLNNNYIFINELIIKIGNKNDFKSKLVNLFNLTRYVNNIKRFF